MSYLTVISLLDAKNYLRIDDALTEDDVQITRMINTACQFVENWTNHVLVQANKDYLLVEGCVSVYDYPIDSTVVPVSDVTIEQKTLYNNYYHSTDDTLTLLVGYLTSDLIPYTLIEVAYEIIDLLYYGSKGGESLEKQLSEMSIQSLNQYKRFIV